MNIKPGEYIIRRTLTDEQDSQLLYIEQIYIVLTVDEAHKQIIAVPSVDWICGYQRDLALNYDDLLQDGYSIEFLESKDVKRSGIYKKLNSTTFQMIGHEYYWFNKNKELSACVPYVHLNFNRKLRGHSITT